MQGWAQQLGSGRFAAAAAAWQGWQVTQRLHPAGEFSSWGALLVDYCGGGAGRAVGEDVVRGGAVRGVLQGWFELLKQVVASQVPAGQRHKTCKDKCEKQQLW